MSRKTLSSVSVLMLLAGSFVSLAYAEVTTQDTIAKFADSLGNLTDSVIIEDPATGYIGIGTASPSYKLHVVGGSSVGVVGESSSSIGVVGNSNDSIGVAASTNNPTSPALWVSSAGLSPSNAALYVYGRTFISGALGIGGSAPDGKLQVTVSTPEESTLTAVRGVQNGAGEWGGIGVFGYSVNGIGVRGRSDNFSFAGVQAEGYQAAPANFAMLVKGRSGTTGKLLLDSNTPDFCCTPYSLELNRNTGNGRGRAYGWDTFSSRRWKTNIQTIQGALEKVERLRGVSFDWKKKSRHDIGLIAEEVGEVVPEVVTFEKNGKDALGVDYARLTALLIEAAKEQQSQIRELRAELKGLNTLGKPTAQLEQKDAEIADLKARLDTLEGAVKNVAYRTAWSERTE